MQKVPPPTRSQIPSRRRADGKPRRTPRLGVPTSSLEPVSTLAEGEQAPSWHELVQPGPAGYPFRTLARRVRLGQADEPRGVQGTIPPAPSGPVRLGHYTPRRSPKAAQVPGSREAMRRYRAHEPQLDRVPEVPRLRVIRREMQARALRLLFGGDR